jgi:predicted dithiol-disulfide oxidoreductase (DUF899 family)
MVEVTNAYTFDGPDGTVTRRDLFEGREQLLIDHFMSDPSWEDGCASCTAGTDEISEGFRAEPERRARWPAARASGPLQPARRSPARSSARMSDRGVGRARALG